MALANVVVREESDDDLAAVAAALIFTVAVPRSRALRPLMPQSEDFGGDGEDFGENAEGRR